VRRAPPAAVGVGFAVAVALIVTITGPLALFNPWFTAIQQQRHDVPARLGTDAASVAAVMDEILADVWGRGEFTASLDGVEPLLDANERSHMQDVSDFVRLLAAINVAALLAVGLTGWLLRHEPGRRGRLMAIGGGAVGVGAIGLAIVFAVAFRPAFLAFHELFFEPGTYLFPPDSNLIRLFPEPFWFDAALAAGASIVLPAAALVWIGWRDSRARRGGD
jgi:integral membrane protein (TIGR01906 family)